MCETPPPQYRTVLAGSHPTMWARRTVQADNHAVDARGYLYLSLNGVSVAVFPPSHWQGVIKGDDK